jgi:SOS-response transcriptional repressor LexA
MQKVLSPLEKKLLQHIAKHVRKNGYQPSYREIAKAWGYRRPGYIATLVSKLEQRGIVTTVGSRALSFDHKPFI